ncbi:hypothetical protein M885DRAFT_559871 [Pelagophyceae sp. CCMP2097]|nr:hypothetical protein M885DRAFT_559871 [Pelagophyceae sp. CCMP2097]
MSYQTGAILPGLLGSLPAAVQERLRSTVANGSLGPTDLDPKVVNDLAAMDHASGLVVIDRFLSSNLFQIRNKSGFLVGIIQRFRAEAPGGVGAAGGVASHTDREARTIHVLNRAGVSNLNAHVTTDVLKQIFGCIGRIMDVRVLGASLFDKVESANAAVDMDGTEVCGARLRVTKALVKPMGGDVMPDLGAAAGGLAMAPGQITALASIAPRITSPAVLAALQKQKQTAAGGDGDGAAAEALNPAQQRARAETLHNALQGKAAGKAWGVSKRRDSSAESSSSSSSSGSSRRRSRRSKKKKAKKKAHKKDARKRESPDRRPSRSESRDGRRNDDRRRRDSSRGRSRRERSPSPYKPARRGRSDSDDRGRR